MRISDWSSDVCSSDLPSPLLSGSSTFRCVQPVTQIRIRPTTQTHVMVHSTSRRRITHDMRGDTPAAGVGAIGRGVVEGKRVSVRVDLGGRRIIKKKHKLHSTKNKMYK